MDKPKDPLINVRNVIRGKNSKGADRFQLYIGGEDQYGNDAIVALIETLQANVTNPKGVKIDLHVGRRTTNDGSREFDSAYFFVKKVEESSTNRGRPQLVDNSAAVAKAKAELKG